TGALVPPRRVPYVPGGAVAVEQPAPVDSPEIARLQQRLHPHEVRLEPVVVGGVADGPMAAPERGERLERAVVRCQQGLLDQHVLAAAEQVREEVDLDVVRDGDHRRIVRVDRDVIDLPVPGVRLDRIDGTHDLVAGHRETLATLNPEADDDYPHPPPPRLNRTGPAARPSRSWPGGRPG